MNFSGYLLVYNAFVSANGEEVEETSHHEHLLDVIVDVLNNNASTLGSNLLTDGKEKAQT